MAGADTHAELSQQLACIKAELDQLRRECGNRPGFDRIEAAVDARTKMMLQLTGTLRAVRALVADELGSSDAV